MGGLIMLKNKVDWRKWKNILVMKSKTTHTDFYQKNPNIFD